MDTLIVVEITAYLIGPVLMAWGWIRWIRHHPREWTVGPLFSFAGFLLATAAYAEGAAIILLGLRGYLDKGNALIYPLFLCGYVLSLSAVVCTMGGVWRKGPLRWQAPAFAVCALFFWMLGDIGL